ncbi:MAG: CsgG/HfaB family protein [Bacteroidota bacterium]
MLVCSRPLMLRSLLALLAAGLLAACAPAGVATDEGALDRAITRAQADLVRRPDNVRVRRDLGVLLAQAERFGEAEGYLRQAYVDDSSDPKTVYYLGLTLEAEGSRDEAIRFHGQFVRVSPRSPFRPLLQGRYEWLTRERLREEVGDLVAREDTLGSDTGPPGVVAVFPFAYLGSDPQFMALGRGLGEMVTADLARIGGLQVVERVRLQALLDELSLAQRAAFDQRTTPRLGRLLRAGRAVGGSFDVSDGDLRVDAALWDLDEPEPALQTRTDDLNRLFRLKREVVLGIVDQIGVTLSPEERAALDVVPTRNLQAFLLYARGLQEEDDGNFAAAASAYQAAVKRDPGFGEAAARAEQARAVERAGGSVGKGLAAARTLGNVRRIDLVGSRLQRLNDSVGSTFLPGGTSRNPAGEGATGSGVTFEPLPGPPGPPGGNRPR